MNIWPFMLQKSSDQRLLFYLLVKKRQCRIPDGDYHDRASVWCQSLVQHMSFLTIGQGEVEAPNTAANMEPPIGNASPYNSYHKSRIEGDVPFQHQPRRQTNPMTSNILNQ
jgi:hypothetical protein